MSQAAPKQFLTNVASDLRKSTKKDAEQELAGMVAPDQYIGDLITLDYGHADILVHDTQRNRANGIPHGCLLLATRITPADLSEKKLPKDPSLLLIRVSESARLRSDADLEIARLEAVKRANDTDRTYDESGHTDQFTLNMLRYSGIRCRILGTFRACESGSDDEWVIHYGSDISNFNAGQGMKIYKPSGPSLERIVNRRRIEKDSSSERKVGRLRYSAAIMEADAPEAVPVSIQASDFIAQRTALFGMTRTGKSNTTKTIAKALFELRSEDGGVRVGQLIFDPNGEYANDNPQDQGCLRNLQYEKSEYEGHVQTYGSHEHPHDPERNITKFNFYGAQEPQSPPASEVDACMFLQRRAQWRYAKGVPKPIGAKRPQVALGDAARVLPRNDEEAGLVLTSPPYRGVTNYRADSWLRLWALREGSCRPDWRTDQKFENAERYEETLSACFGETLKRTAANAVWCVRADARQRTREVVVRVLNGLLPDHQLRECPAPYKMATQTALYGDKTQKPGEVDLYYMPQRHG